MSISLPPNVYRSLFLVVWLILALSCSRALDRTAASPSPLAAAAAVEFGSDTAPQHAVPEDIHVFDPYIGRFQSKKMYDPDLGKELHYIVEYAWFDAGQSIVRFMVSAEYVGDDEASVNAQGYYGFDPFHRRLYTIGFFAAGSTGFGAVGEFDRATGRRVTWARSKGPDGATVYVRDAFEVIDADSWSDVTAIRGGDDTDWHVVYRDTFTRIAAAR